MKHISPIKSLLEEQQDEIDRLRAAMDAMSERHLRDYNDLLAKWDAALTDCQTYVHFLLKAERAITQAQKRWWNRAFNLICAKASVRAALWQVATKRGRTRPEPLTEDPTS